MNGAKIDLQLPEFPDQLAKLLRNKMASKKRSLNDAVRSGDTQSKKIPVGQRNDALTSLAGKLRRQGLTENVIRAALLEANSDHCEEPLSENEVAGIAKSVSRYKPAVKKFPRTDAGNAELFAAMNSKIDRYDHDLGIWQIWQGHWFERDKSDTVVQQAKACARYRYELASDLEDLGEREKEARWAIQSESHPRISAMLKLAQSEPLIAVPKGTMWNSDPMLLGVKNGVVDLSSGRLRPGRHSDLISKHIPINYHPKARCPRWLIFLSEILNSNAKLIRYVWKALAYSLTGLTREQVYFILHGSGANGKSKLILVLSTIFGSYSSIAPFSMLAKRRSSQTNDLAALVDKRIVFASESRQNTVIDEAILKLLTGSDWISVRFLYKEFTSFPPRLKLWLALNHLPIVTDMSYGFWRRVRRIPLDVRFEGASDDKQIEQKLLAESEGILAWLITGVSLYLKQGLDPPDIVLVATQEYHSQSDPLNQFVSDRCVVGPNQKVGANQFFKDYEAWAATQVDIVELSSVEFGNRMAAQFMRKRSGPGRFYHGIGLKTIKNVPGV